MIAVMAKKATGDLSGRFSDDVFAQRRLIHVVIAAGTGFLAFFWLFSN